MSWTITLFLCIPSWTVRVLQKLLTPMGNEPPPFTPPEPGPLPPSLQFTQPTPSDEGLPSPPGAKSPTGESVVLEVFSHWCIARHHITESVNASGGVIGGVAHQSEDALTSMSCTSVVKWVWSVPHTYNLFSFQKCADWGSHLLKKTTSI